MCGVSGFIDTRPAGALAPERREALEASARRLAHRGPDGQGVWVSACGRAGLAHRRLAIVDLTEGGHQPMISRSGRSVLSFNGEIYNHRELATALGIPTRSRSDSEVLLEAVEREGAGILSKLDGMFAAAVYDERRRHMLLFTDPAGKKPLYTYWDGTIFAFASEIKALAELPGVALEEDPERLPEFLAFGYVPSPATFYRNVRKLRAGHYQVVSLDSGPKKPEIYWDVPLGRIDHKIERREAAEELRRLLGRAVQKRLMADVPVGCFLSGGLDSTAVAYEAARLSPQPLMTFNAAFSHDEFASEYDESPFARKAAATLGTNHFEFEIRASADDARRTLRHFDEPFGDSSALALASLCRHTSNHVKAVLSGDGADELFGGYRRFQGALISESMRPFAGLLGLLPRSPSAAARSRRGFFNRYTKAIQAPLLRRMVIWNDFFSDQEFERMLGYRTERAWLALREFEERTRGLPADEQLLYFNFKSYLFDDLLPKADRTSMAFGLEVRSPFLDRDLIDFAFRLPVNFKFSLNGCKKILKDAYRPLIGTEITDRPKRGFGFPLESLLRSNGARTDFSEVRRYIPLLDVSLDSFDRADVSRVFLLWSLEALLRARKDSVHAQGLVQHCGVPVASPAQPGKPAPAPEHSV